MSILRFFIVGIFVNLLLYFLYLFLENQHYGHKVSMTIVYIIGVCISFLLNSTFTFKGSLHWSNSFLRYLLLYLIAYILNYSILVYGVDMSHYPHEFVQGGAVILIAAFSYLGQRFIVFKS